MKEKIKLEEIEGFNDLSYIEQEYLRVMQGEFELRTSDMNFPGKFEMIASIIMFSAYIIFSIRENCVNISTFSAAAILVVDLIWLYEDFFS